VPKRPTDDRIKLLEAKRQALRAQSEPSVVYGLPGELPQETAARIHAEGRKTPALVIPTFESDEQWARSCAQYQDWILRRTSGLMGDRFESLTDTEIEAAYRKSLTA